MGKDAPPNKQYVVRFNNEIVGVFEFSGNTPPDVLAQIKFNFDELGKIRNFLGKVGKFHKIQPETEEEWRKRYAESLIYG